MEKLPIKKVVEGLLKLQDSGDSATLLGIGPMSPNLLQASFEIARDYDFQMCIRDRRYTLQGSMQVMVAIPKEKR